MGSISSTSPNVAQLLQTLSIASPQLSSILSTPKMRAALGKASPGDLVHLSDQALQLQQVGQLFGSSNATQPSVLDTLAGLLFPAPSAPGSGAQPDPMLQALESSLGIAGATGTASRSTPSNQIANSASGFQAQELNALFGIPQTVYPLLNTLG
jgi:hypothetical protein